MFRLLAALICQAAAATGSLIRPAVSWMIVVIRLRSSLRLDPIGDEGGNTRAFRQGRGREKPLETAQ
jgi:hypothetical protein